MDAMGRKHVFGERVNHLRFTILIIVVTYKATAANKKITASIITTPEKSYVDEEVSLFCVVTGTSKVDFQQWLRDAVQTNDSGRYTCRVLPHETGEYVSVSQDLKIQGPADIIAKRKHFQVPVGSQVEFICHGHNVQMVRWFFNGSPARTTPTGRIRTLNIRGTHLLVNDVQVVDAGTYTCRGMNRNDSDEDSMTLEVTVIPAMSTRPEDVTSYPGEKAVLECKAVGLPTPDLYWIKESPDGAMELLQGNGSLKFEYLSLHDAGKYTCVAKNIAGNISASAILQVQESMDWLAFPISSNDMVACIHCPCNGNTTDFLAGTVTWMKDGTMISGCRKNYRCRIMEGVGSGGFHLIVKRPNFTDSGEYSCNVQNKHGISVLKRRTVLSVIGRPDPPSNVHVSGMCGSDWTVSWSPPPFDGNFPVAHYTVTVTSYKLYSSREQRHIVDIRQRIDSQTSPLTCRIRVECHREPAVYGVEVKAEHQYGTSESALPKTFEISEGKMNRTYTFTATNSGTLQLQKMQQKVVCQGVMGGTRRRLLLLKHAPRIQIKWSDPRCTCQKLRNSLIGTVLNSSRQLVLQVVEAKLLNDFFQRIAWNGDQNKYVYQVPLKQVSISTALRLVERVRANLELSPRLYLYPNCTLDIDLNCKTLLIDTDHRCQTDDGVDCPQIHKQTGETRPGSDKRKFAIVVLPGAIVAIVAAAAAIYCPRKWKKRKTRSENVENVFLQK